jgi:hypothetical protein
MNSETTDALCCICDQWCTKRSSCSRRYSTISGDWDNEPDQEMPSQISICDYCHTKLQPESGNRFSVKGRLFFVDFIFREND